MQRIILGVVIMLLVSCKKEKAIELNSLNGEAFGTTFSLQFFDTKERDYKKSFDSIIEVINRSMSTYQRDSDISKINQGDSTVTIDANFQKVFVTSQKIFAETKGAFDPTVGVLVNAWDFGPEGKIISLDSIKIDSLLKTVGLQKMKLLGNRIVKQHPYSYIDFNALAKGYAVDVFSEFLETKGHDDYIVEIGGEIRAKGKHLIKQKPWKIGVEDPNFDDKQSYSKIISLQNEAMATSGSYRKFKIDENGNRYAHIIDAKTGYPHRSNLLSTSVITSNCMEADAYATALMSMGLEKSKTFLTSHPHLKVFFIYEDAQKELKTVSLNGFPEN